MTAEFTRERISVWLDDSSRAEVIGQLKPGDVAIVIDEFPHWVRVLTKFGVGLVSDSRMVALA